MPDISARHNCNCVAVNCGEDTDCTAATAGSLFGIMNGIDAIDQKWIDPIGNKINTMTLNIGDFAYTDDQGISTRIPADVNELSERTEKVARQMIMDKDLGVVVSDTQETDLSAIADAALYLMTTKPELGIKDPYELNQEQYKAALTLLRGFRKTIYILLPLFFGK